MSMAAVPPAQVKRVRSISKSSSVTSISGNCSRSESWFSQWIVQRCSSSSPRPGQDVGPRADRPDRHPARRQGPQPGRQFAMVEGLDVDARADDRGRRAAEVGEAALDRDLDPVRRRDRLAVGREHAPREGVVTLDAVGEPQWLDGRREGDHREARHQQEGDGGDVRHGPAQRDFAELAGRIRAGAPAARRRRHRHRPGRAAAGRPGREVAGIRFTDRHDEDRSCSLRRSTRRSREMAAGSSSRLCRARMAQPRRMSNQQKACHDAGRHRRGASQASGPAPAERHTNHDARR